MVPISSKLRKLMVIGLAAACGALALLWPEWRLEVQAIYYFKTSDNFAAGVGPVSVAVGDFNGDRKLDLAVADFGTLERRDPTVSILLADKKGGYGSPISFFANFPEFVIVADFNRDGKLDLALANPGPDTVSILLGNGKGSFGTAKTFVPSVLQPRSIAVGDFNHDGNLDLAVAGASSDNVAIQLGDGAGGFVEAAILGAGFGPVWVATADLNRDGNLDLAVADVNDGNVSILLGDGTGSFLPAMTFPGNFPISVAVGDFNGDGFPDLALANPGFPIAPGPAGVSILLGNGTGLFETPILTTGIQPTWLEPNGFFQPLAIADFNHDGNLDVAVAEASKNDVAILLGRGTGAFGKAMSLATGDNPVALTTADLSGSHNLDLAVANFKSNNVSVLLIKNFRDTPK